VRARAAGGLREWKQVVVIGEGGGGGGLCLHTRVWAAQCVSRCAGSGVARAVWAGEAHEAR